MLQIVTEQLPTTTVAYLVSESLPDSHIFKFFNLLHSCFHILAESGRIFRAQTDSTKIVSSIFEFGYSLLLFKPRNIHLKGLKFAVLNTVTSVLTSVMDDSLVYQGLPDFDRKVKGFLDNFNWLQIRKDLRAHLLAEPFQKEVFMFSTLTMLYQLDSFAAKQKYDFKSPFGENQGEVFAQELIRSLEMHSEAFSSNFYW